MGGFQKILHIFIISDDLFTRVQNLLSVMSKKFLMLFFSRVQFLIMSKNVSKISHFHLLFFSHVQKNTKNFLKILHR